MKDKKVLILEIIIGIVFVGAITLVWFFNTPKVTGEDNVSMGVFNETIEKLNVKLDDMQKNIDTLKATNNDLQAEIEVLNNKSVSLQKQITNNNTLIGNSITRITNIETRENGLYKILMGSYSSYGLYVQFKKLKPDWQA